MIIPKRIIPKYSSISGSFNYPLIDYSALVVIMIASFHLQGKINDAKMKAMLKNHRDDKLMRKVNTHHCKINNKWYNGESMSEVLMDAHNEVCVSIDITVEQLVRYLLIYTGKNKNYCINWIYTEIIARLINNSDNIECFNTLIDCRAEGFTDNILSYEQAERKYDLSSGYCCRDCDGCLGEYKRMEYDRIVGGDIRNKMDKLFKTDLIKYKSKDALKNPNELLKIK